MDIKETILKVKEEIVEDYPEIQDEKIEKYIEAFLKEKRVITEISYFINHCIANKREV